MNRRALTALLYASTALGDYQADLHRINQNGDQIDAQMRTMGFFLNRKDAAKDNAEQPRRKLIQVHADNSALRAEAGRRLSAVTSNRLVVGPEGSPAIVVVEGNQGLFTGLKILGTAKQGSSEGRLLIDLDRLVFRTGKVQQIKGMVLDENGGYGLKAQVLSGKALMVAGSLASSFISGYAASQQSHTQSPFGFSQPQTGARNGVLQGVAQTAADQSKRLIEDATKEKPVLVVEPDTKVSVYLDEEVRF